MARDPNGKVHARSLESGKVGREEKKGARLEKGWPNCRIFFIDHVGTRA